MPDSRSNLIANMDGDALWSLPEIYDNVREAVIPGPGKTNLQPWEAVDQIYMYMGNGKVNGIVSRLMEDRGQAETSLTCSARRSTRGSSGSPSGPAAGRSRRSSCSAGASSMRGRPPSSCLMATDKEIPSSARMIIGQELDGMKAVAEIQRKLYEGAVEDEEKRYGIPVGTGQAAGHPLPRGRQGRRGT